MTAKNKKESKSRRKWKENTRKKAEEAARMQKECTKHTNW